MLRYGKGLIKALAEIAAERGCGRLEWWCLDSNKPSIDFICPSVPRPWRIGLFTE